VILRLFIPLFKYPLCLCQLQDLTKFELAEMPSYNLAKSVHNKWLQQSGNWGTNLYIATVDDFVWALMQVVRYYHYLKGEHTSIRPGKEKLLLRAVQHSTKQTGDPKVLNAAMANCLEWIYSALVSHIWLVKRYLAPKSTKPMFLLVIKASHTSRTK
jgi:hypothetical protein